MHGNDRFDTSVAAGPDFIADWVRAMKAQFPGLFAERRVIFALGNEPMLWNSTHRDVHPEPVSYDEYLERFVNMARALKAAAPEAKLAGPELWGWPAYFQSAQDRETKSDADRRRHGNEEFLPWFLRQMRQQERQGGTRLLDYVTVHFYPQAQNVFSPAVDLDATRAADGNGAIAVGRELPRPVLDRRERGADSAPQTVGCPNTTRALKSD